MSDRSDIETPRRTFLFIQPASFEAHNIQCQATSYHQSTRSHFDILMRLLLPAQ